MKKEKLTGIIFIAAAAILYVVGVIILPDTLVVQLSIGNSEPNTMNKYFALIIPFAITVFSSVSYMKSNDNRTKSLIGAILGIVLIAVTYVVNL